jgi:prevent-host-death family protein
MDTAEQMALADMKNRLSEVVERIEREHGRVVITKHGRPAAVVLSIDDLESLEETLAVMSDPVVMADIGAARADRDAGIEPERLTKDAALRLVSRE